MKLFIKTPCDNLIFDESLEAMAILESSILRPLILAWVLSPKLTPLSPDLETNIFLRCDDKKIKNNLKMDNGSKLEVFTKLRNLKDKF